MMQSYLAEYKQRKLVVESWPRVENIELTSYCNLKCPGCLPRSARKEEHMPIDKLRNILDENSQVLKGQKVWIHFNGETLLYPNLEEALSLFRIYDVNPRISTNATVLDDYKSHVILDGGVCEVVFSIDGATQEIYETARPGAKYEDVVRNTKRFIDLSRKYTTRPEIQIQMVESTLTEGQADAFIQYWKDSGADSISLKRFSTRANNVVNSAIALEYANLGVPCFWPWRAVVVLVNADVVPCCTDMKGEIVLGNLTEQSLLDIWNSEKMQQLRQAHLTNEYGSLLCARCTDHYDPCDEVNERQRYNDKKHKFVG
ncbi:MAG: radical SAM/SPASM domain-containing protein [Candidatus Aenigmatarchaeota archaeon]